MSKKRVQRFKNAKITKVALLTVPSAVGALGIYKSEEETNPGMLGQAMAKYAPKEGLLYSLVMVPNRVDKHGHWETPEDVQNACHSWAEEGCVLDLNHADPKLQGKDLLRSDAVAVENLIVQEGDIRFKGILIDGEEVDPTGGWGTVIRIKDPGLISLAEQGKLNQLSIYSPPGGYELTNEQPLRKAQEDPMDKTRFEALEAIVSSLVETVKALVEKPKEVPVAKSEIAVVVEEPKAPDMTDPDQVEKVLKARKLEALQKNYDLEDPEQLDQYLVELRKMQAPAPKGNPSSVRKSAEEGRSEADEKDQNTPFTFSLGKAINSALSGKK